jgi:hypothetical protein
MKTPHQGLGNRLVPPEPPLALEQLTPLTEKVVVRMQSERACAYDYGALWLSRSLNSSEFGGELRPSRKFTKNAELMLDALVDQV